MSVSNASSCAVRVLVGVLLCGSVQVFAQGNSRASQTYSSAPQSVAQNNTSTSQAVEVTGRVLDVRDRAPIARVLVSLGGRSVLTDHDGVFRLPEVTSTSVSFTFSKPGYYPTPDGGSSSSRSYRLPLTSPIELLLYPEAVLSGTATDALGDGLPHLNVVARRSVFDENGHHWSAAGQTQTTNDGKFWLPVSPGTYSLFLNSHGRISAGTEVVLPLSVPANNSSLIEAIRLAPGERTNLDLRPDVRRSYLVQVTTESETRGFPTLSARTTSGSVLRLNPLPWRDQSELRVALPRGSYTLVGTIQDRDGLYEAQAQVTVTDHDTSGPVLRFLRSPTLPVVVEVDSSAVSDNTKVPDAGQLGLALQLVGDAPDGNTTMWRLNTRPNVPSSFSVPGGTYHLRAQSSGGQWYIASAICGGVDLLSQDLPVSSDLGGTEIRVRISNRTATLSGTVRLNGAPGAAWIYLLASGPSATPLLILRSSSTDGKFFRPYLPPGNYRILALENKLQADLQSATTLNQFLDRLQTFSITSGEQHTLTLDAVPERELTP